MASDTVAPAKPIITQFQYWPLNLERTQIQAGPYLRFAARAKDVAAGIRTILEIDEHDKLRIENDEPTLLSINDRCNLARLAMVALRELSEDADTCFQWVKSRSKDQVEC